jgi:hypothetical protein
MRMSAGRHCSSPTSHTRRPPRRAAIPWRRTLAPPESGIACLPRLLVAAAARAGQIYRSKAQHSPEEPLHSELYLSSSMREPSRTARRYERAFPLLASILRGIMVTDIVEYHEARLAEQISGAAWLSPLSSARYRLRRAPRLSW